MRLSSADLVTALNPLPDRPWSTGLDGKPINQAWLGRHLHPLVINSRTLRLKNHRAKGYDVADFADAFAQCLQNGPAV